MRVVRVESPRGGARLGVVVDDEVALLPEKRYGSGRGFIALVREAARRRVSAAQYLQQRISSDRRVKRIRYSELGERAVRGFRLLMPIVPPEVWGAGVTYLRSREAREYETKAKGIYDLVYEAERPEIFFKATPSRCVGPEEVAYIRSDTRWSVPEPELAIVLGPKQEIVGYTIGNDLSARDIEGENPLYLPQAKIYRGCCVIGPAIALPETIGDPKNLRIEMRVLREGAEIFKGWVNTSNLKRGLDELVSYLARDNVIPAGTVLLTGTGIVPPDDFSLRSGDIVEIEIEKIGVLRNRIEQLSSRGKRS
ncbi:MAG: fumarylacetoacetate hydrolase family protein [Nitrososphaerota archaeon]